MHKQSTEYNYTLTSPYYEAASYRPNVTLSGVKYITVIYFTPLKTQCIEHYSLNLDLKYGIFVRLHGSQHPISSGTDMSPWKIIFNFIASEVGYFTPSSVTVKTKVN